jgi:hypothetical protein
MPFEPGDLLLQFDNDLFITERPWQARRRASRTISAWREGRRSQAAALDFVRL